MSRRPTAIDEGIPPWLTVAEVGASLRVNAAKVLAWIHDGQLAAINVAGPKASRPIYRVSRDALAEFERSRQVSTAVADRTHARPRRRKSELAVREFY